QAQRFRAAHATVELHSSYEILPAQAAGVRGNGLGQAARSGESVAELEALFLGKIALHNEVLSDIPVLNIAGENELGFQFVGMGLAELGVVFKIERRLAHNFLLNAAALVDVFVFQVEDRVNGMLGGQGSKAALQAPTGEDGAVPGGGLALQVELRGPPAVYSVLQFGKGRDVGPLPAARHAGSGVHLQFEIAGLLQVMVVSDEIGGVFLGASRKRKHKQQ